MILNSGPGELGVPYGSAIASGVPNASTLELNWSDSSGPCVDGGALTHLGGAYDEAIQTLLRSSATRLDEHTLGCFEAFRSEVRAVKALGRRDVRLAAATDEFLTSRVSSPLHRQFLARLSEIEVNLEYQRALGVIDGTVSNASLCHANHDYRSILAPEIELTTELLGRSSDGRSVMIGAGPLPISTVFFSQELGAERCIAIDCDPVAAAIGASVLGSLSNGTRYIPRAGESFDFRPVDVPLVATMVADRVDVLRHMYNCGVENVVVRNVFGAAQLCYSGSSITELESTGYRVVQTLAETDSVLVTALHLERVA
jgi:hypothetical protein